MVNPFGEFKPPSRVPRGHRSPRCREGNPHSPAALGTSCRPLQLRNRQQDTSLWGSASSAMGWRGHVGSGPPHLYPNRLHTRGFGEQSVCNMVPRAAAGLRWLLQFKLIKHNVQIQLFGHTSHILQVFQSRGATVHHTRQRRRRMCPESPTGGAGVDRCTRSGFDSQLCPSELRLPGQGFDVSAPLAPVCGVGTPASS